jgi:hypothetical protein
MGSLFLFQLSETLESQIVGCVHIQYRHSFQKVRVSPLVPQFIERYALLNPYPPDGVILFDLRIQLS